MGRRAERRGQVTHHVDWGSGCLPGTASMAGHLHSHLAQARQAPSPSGETAPTRRAQVGEPQERVPSLPSRRSRQWGAREVVAGVGGDENSVGEKICLGWRSGRGAGSWMGRERGLSRGDVFIIFFFLWLGEEKKIKILIPSQRKSMFAPSQHHGGGWARQI